MNVSSDWNLSSKIFFLVIMSNYFKFYFLASLKLWVFFKDRWNTLPPITPISNATIQHPWHLRNPLTVSSTNQPAIQPISNETNQRVLRRDQLKSQKSRQIIQDQYMHCFGKPFEKRVIFLKNTKRKFGGFFLNFFFLLKKWKTAWCLAHLLFTLLVYSTYNRNQNWIE